MLKQLPPPRAVKAAASGRNTAEQGFPRLPPAGYPFIPPQHEAKPILVDEAGQPIDFSEGGRKVTGAIIEFCVDQDKRTLFIGLNGGPLVEAVAGFPPNVALRPFVRFEKKQDRVSFAEDTLRVA